MALSRAQLVPEIYPKNIAQTREINYMYGAAVGGNPYLSTTKYKP